jgi:hypothetical protein
MQVRYGRLAVMPYLERMMTDNESDVLGFLEEYPEVVRGIALELRRTILSAMPGVHETLDRSARIIGYGFSTGYRDMVCTIIPSKTGVKLGIAQGAELSEYADLLQGTGKRHRHVSLTELSDLKKPGLRPLLAAAFAAWQARSKRGG